MPPSVYGGVFVAGSLAWGMLVDGFGLIATTWWVPSCA
jgi:drug/metabolite transporter superfamily protein YnfA